MVTVGGAVVLGALWLAVTGLMARDLLVEAAAKTETLRAAVVRGDLPGARSVAGTLASDAQRAHALTGGPVWALASAVPGGEPVRSVRGITASVDELAGVALPALVEAGTVLDPASLRQPDGSLDLARLTSTRPQLSRAVAAVSSATARVDALPRRTWLPAVDQARTDLAAQLTDLGAQVRSADLAVRIAPAMLGQDGPKRYFVTFQNESEARGTGGLPGAFAIMEADRGKVSFTQFGSDAMLSGVSADVSFGPEYDQLYAGAGTTTMYGNSNLSPHFPYAAQIWASMWRKRSGERVDGALALDPTALSYLLAVRGPVTLPDGTVVSADNVVALTQSTAYARFGNDGEGRKAFLLGLAAVVSKHVLDPGGSTTDLVRALAKAAGERRLLVWSADPAVQSELEQTPLSGAIPKTPAPYVGLSIVNDGGNKLDYYLGRHLTWQRRGCGPTRQVTVSVTLTNDAPTGLPAYVTGRSDMHSYPVQPGDNRLEVSYLATTGALMTGVRVDGQPTTSRIGSQLGHPLYTVNLELPRGTSRTVVLSLTEPAGAGAPVVLRQPLVRPLTVVLDDEACPPAAPR